MTEGRIIHPASTNTLPLMMLMWSPLMLYTVTLIGRFPVQRELQRRPVSAAWRKPLSLGTAMR